ncbi:MAG: hypothetical protein P1U81_02645 [Verrucomicrobiales bacterium]|nr:hypothetical protein [Verrucomicrobiales bacterium]
MSPESLIATLGSMRQAGSVFGVLFSKDTEEIFSDLAYSPERVEAMVSVLDDIVAYFNQEGRSPEILSFCYDGGNLLLVLSKGHRLVVLHHHADEVDFIAKAAGAFLKDYFTGQSVQEWAGKKEVIPGPPKEKKPKEKEGSKSPLPQRPVDPTAPITPVR